MEKPLPLYQCIKKDIKESIKNGKYAPGDKIPSESELGAAYKASRITVVRAINDLVSEGQLRREHGKGSFVTGSIRENVMKLTGFHERMQILKLPLVTQLLERKKGVIPLEMAEHFQLPDDTPAVYLKRLRIVDGKPLCISKAYFILEGNEWLLTADLEKESVYSLLEKQYHQSLGNAVQRFGVGFLKKKEAEVLTVKENDALLKLSLYTSLKTGKAFEYDVTYYNPDYYEYEILMSRELGTL